MIDTYCNKIDLVINILKDNKVNNLTYYFDNFNDILDDIHKFCIINNYDIPENRIIFCIRLLGQINVTEKTLFLLQGLIYRDDKILKIVFSNPYDEILLLFDKLKNSLSYLDSIFFKKEKNKRIKVKTK